MEGTEKIFCSNPSMDAMGMAAMMNGGYNSWQNNPFLYLILLAMFGGNGFGWGGNRGAMHTEQFDSLRNQIADNQNNQLAMGAIKGNASAIDQLATNLGCSVNSLQQAVCSVKSAIEGLGGKIGFSAERVINAVNMGDCNVIQAIKDCCCTTQKSILEMGYQNQIQNLQQTNTLQSTINGVGNAMERGFSDNAFRMNTLACDLKTSANDNTRAILGKLDQIEDSRKDREIASLTAQLATVNARAERQAELAPINKALEDIQCRQVSTITVPNPSAVAVPTCLAYGAGLFGAGQFGYNGGIFG